jgi:hypothetical protein
MVGERGIYALETSRETDSYIDAVDLDTGGKRSY